MTDLEALARAAEYFADRERTLRSQALRSASYSAKRDDYTARRKLFARMREAVEAAIEAAPSNPDANWMLDAFAATDMYIDPDRARNPRCVAYYWFCAGVESVALYGEPGKVAAERQARAQSMVVGKSPIRAALEATQETGQ